MSKLAEVARWHVENGDILILTVQGAMRAEMVERLREGFRQLTDGKDVKVVILEDGIRPTVVHRADLRELAQEVADEIRRAELLGEPET